MAGSNSMIAPTPGQQFTGLRSGTDYIADANGIISNVQSSDVMPLLNAGCRFPLPSDLPSIGVSMSYAGNPTAISYTPITITSNTFTLATANDLIKVNKTTGSATAISLPVMTVDRDYVVQDAKGDAGTNNITITTTQGDGKIDGQSSALINTNYMSLTVRFDGTTTTIN